jgi:hypothetical protein
MDVLTAIGGPIAGRTVRAAAWTFQVPVVDDTADEWITIHYYDRVGDVLLYRGRGAPLDVG